MKLRSALLTAVLLLAPLAVVAPSASAALPPPGTPTSAAKPTIIGEPAQIGQTLTATKGTWYFVGTRPGTTAPVFTYQWLREGEPIAGATSAKYTPRAAFFSSDLGYRLSVRVTVHKVGYSPQSATSNQTNPVVPGRFVAGKPSISGFNTVGETLTVDPGTWTPSPYSTPDDLVPNSGFIIRWYSGGAQVAECTLGNPCGLIGSPYMPTANDVGKQIKVTVTAVRYGYLDMTRTAYAGYTNSFASAA